MISRKILSAAFAAAFIAGTTGCVYAADSAGATDGNDRFVFASKAIRDWQVEGDRVIYVERNMNDWYKAELMGPCVGLQFQNRIGFDFGPTDTFDKFSAIIVDGQRCNIKSVTKIEGKPPTKEEAEAAKE